MPHERRVQLRLALLGLLILPLAGCIGGTPVDVTTLELDCHGRNGIAAMENGALDSCWGHIGHHTYFLDGRYEITAWNGSMFAVEIELTDTPVPPVVHLATSLDGAQWEPLATVDYPSGGDGRHRIAYAWEGSREAVFLRIHMPHSSYDGLAGYLDSSNGTVIGTRLGPAPIGGLDGGACDDGTLMEAFFDAHPCWFGGRDGLNDGRPDHQVAAAETHPSWFDSPSFMHTYMVAGDGAFTGTATPYIWRVAHVATCGARDPLGAADYATVRLQASPDGVIWTDRAEARVSWGEPVTINAELPDVRFVRFIASDGAFYEAGGCHHPIAYLGHSTWAWVR